MQYPQRQQTMTQQQIQQQALQHAVQAITSPLVAPQNPGYHGWQQQPYGIQVPLQAMMPMSTQMPAYLTVAEPRRENESIWSVLFIELVRSIFKSLGHTAAHFFDNTPLRSPPKQ
jgi:hypothetical protein